MTTQTDTAPLSAEDLRRRADKERVFGAFQDAFDDLASTKVGRLELRIMFAKANIDRDQAADALDALSARVVELEHQLDLSEKQRSELLHSINFRKACNRDANAAEARATQAEAERDALREYVASTEYWKLDPHDAKERAAYLEQRLRAALSPAQPAQDRIAAAVAFIDRNGPTPGADRFEGPEVSGPAQGADPLVTAYDNGVDHAWGVAQPLAEAAEGVINWCDFAMSQSGEFDAHGVRNLSGPAFDKLREAVEAVRSAGLLTTETEGK